MKLLFIGIGKMGFPIISSWVKNKKKISIDIHIVEKNKLNINLIKKNNIKIKISKQIPDSWKGDIIFFAVKPQDFKKITQEILSKNINYKNVISIMAGIKINKIRSELNTEAGITRVMPNLAVEVNLGVNCIFHSRNTKAKTRSIIDYLFNLLGNNYEIKNEKLLDTVTAISGSGPAYFFLFLHVFESIANDLGFSKKYSRNLVFDTIEGAFKLAKKEKNIRKLISSVSSKKGTTEAALKILEKKNTGLYKLMKDSINAAKKRANNLSKII